jgi:hypothetical protein
MIQCLRSLDLVAICCEIEGNDMVALWVQINPKAIATILGTEQELVQPKTKDGITMTVRVPEDLTPVYTDVRFPIVAMDSHPRADAPN